MESIFHKIDCVHCRLSSVCLSNGLAQEEVNQFERVVKRKRPIKSDEYLYRQEDNCTSLFVVKSGSFRSFIWDIDGGEQTIGFYLPGELMGLDALHQSQRHHCSVVALETSSVCELPIDRFNGLCTKIPRLQAQFLRIVGAQLVLSQDNMVLLGNRSATVKVANFLLALSERYNALGYSGTDFNLSMARHEIANFLGLSIETVSRQLGYLNKTGAISIKHRGVQINNRSLLKTIVEPCSSKRVNYAY